jgi:hypothetical protein
MSEVIERRREVADMVRLWEAICRGETRITFREFYGIPGIGKTELSKQIKNALEKEGALCAHLDFDPIQNPWGHEPRNEKVLFYYDRPENLFKDLLTEWSYLNSSDLREKLSTNSGKSTFEPQQFAQQVIKHINTLPLGNAVALICDETDHLQWERLSWFEKDFIVPLARSGRCLIVWLGRREKQWLAELASIKAKVKSSLLEPFSSDYIVEQLNANGVKIEKEHEDRLLNWLHDVSQGHPMAVEVVIQRYSQSILNERSLQRNSEVVKDIIERVIKGYILRDNPLQFNEALKLSLLRIVDVSLLRVLIGDLSKSLVSYGKLVNELRANPLGDCRERLLKKSVAIWLQRYFRISDPKGYLEKQDTLLQECTRLCNRAGRDNWSTYVVESIYHAASANTVTQKYDLSKILEEHLRSSKLSGDSDAMLMELKEIFLNDKEIEEYIGKDGIDHLIAILDNERKRLRLQKKAEEQ